MPWMLYFISMVDYNCVDINVLQMILKSALLSNMDELCVICVICEYHACFVSNMHDL